MRSVSVFLLINTSYPVDDIAMDIRLWTWQKKTEFDLANGEQKVESLDNSVFADSPNIMRAYNKLFKKLGTDQFHWYFTQEYEAKNNPSHIQWYKQGCMLWEVKVPIERIFKKVCGIAWTYLLNRPAPPGQLYHDWKKLSDFELVRRQLFTKRLFVPEFSIFKEAVGNFLGRPVYTHEFSSDFVEDLKEEFENVCKERGY